ncbi:hypothetical protein [Pseudonocardia spinosispora]|uniref:hypothetical protein n=1 Tax=Pseudonocardia spinosispora TaxID=103441 RepID=UPI0012EC3CF1|nr:hypothetical protein [Pseudonocardia spinosispora]
MRAHLSLLVFAVTAVLGAGVLAGCAGSSREQTEQPIPTFSSSAQPGLAGQAHPRETLLPVDCADMLPGANMSALLGQPVDSVDLHTVLGVGSPSVGRLERVACQYRRAGAKKGTPPVLEINAAAYTTPAAADTQMTTNSSAERADAQKVENISIGSARAALFTERGKTVMLVASGRSTITMTMLDGVIAPDQTRPVMVDLVQRVLPTLIPEPQGKAR